MATKVTCALVEQWIYLALDGELSDELRAQLDRHLDECADCRARLQRASEDQALLSRELDVMSNDLGQLLEGRLGAEQIADFEAYGDAAQKQARSATATRWRVAAVCVAACAVLALAWGAYFFRDIEIGRFTWESAGLSLRASDGVTHELGESGERTLLAGESLTLSADASMLLHLADGSSIDFQGPGSLEFTVRGGSTRLEMSAGKCAISLEQREDGFCIATPLALTTVVGTLLSVEHHPQAERTTVSITRGEAVVELLQHQGSPVRLRAGEMCRVFRAEIQSGVWKRKDGTQDWEWQRRPSSRWFLEKQPLMIPGESDESSGEEETGSESGARNPAHETLPDSETRPNGQDVHRGAPLDLPRSSHPSTRPTTSPSKQERGADPPK